MTIEVAIPAIGESVSEATVGTWLKDEGAFVEEDEIICEIESEKATIEIVAEKAGVLHQKAQEGETLNIGSIIAEINTDNKAEVKPNTTNAEKADSKGDVQTAKQNQEEISTGTHKKISPVAANILQDAGIKAEKIIGSGLDGRVTKADALKAIEDGNKNVVDKIDHQLPVKQEQIHSGIRNERRIRMTTLRKTIARRLLDAKHGTAMLTTFNEVDLLKVKQLRSEYKDSFKEKHGIGLGFMSFFTKACCVALAEIPEVNGMIDGDEIIFHDYCDIGIAVSTEKGLVVPVIRNADQMTLAQIEMEIARLAGRARDGKLSMDEMTGGTFSITNGGVFGSMMATPIINAPQSAILGMHAIKDRPVVIDGEITIRPMMYIALSYDHRIIDGKESVTFLRRVKELLEDPMRMMLAV